LRCEEAGRTFGSEELELRRGGDVDLVGMDKERMKMRMVVQGSAISIGGRYSTPFLHSIFQWDLGMSAIPFLPLEVSDKPPYDNIENNSQSLIE
jgi:hypothetical protein